MESDFTDCDHCGQHVHRDDMDAKPSRYDRWWWLLLPTEWAISLLRRAADNGEAFNGLYCSWCYGPGYNADLDDV